MEEKAEGWMAPRKPCLPDIKGLMQYGITGTVRACI